MTGSLSTSQVTPATSELAEPGVTAIGVVLEDSPAKSQEHNEDRHESLLPVTRVRIDASTLVDRFLSANRAARSVAEGLIRDSGGQIGLARRIWLLAHSGVTLDDPRAIQELGRIEDVELPPAVWFVKGGAGGHARANEIPVPVSELRSSDYVRRVRQGVSFLVTSRGTPVARLRPVHAEDRTSVTVLSAQDFNSKHSKFLRAVQAGARFLITERGAEAAVLEFVEPNASEPPSGP